MNDKKSSRNSSALNYLVHDCEYRMDWFAESEFGVYEARLKAKGHYFSREQEGKVDASEMLAMMIFCQEFETPSEENLRQADWFDDQLESKTDPTPKATAIQKVGQSIAFDINFAPGHIVYLNDDFEGVEEIVASMDSYTQPSDQPDSSEVEECFFLAQGVKSELPVAEHRTQLSYYRFPGSGPSNQVDMAIANKLEDRIEEFLERIGFEEVDYSKL